MINIQKLIEEANENGYKGVKASAKVCQDIVLKALSIGPMNRNITVKGASLLINSDEQMLAEKLRSLLKFGPFSTRYKDVYDMYYLKDIIDKGKLRIAINTYIFSDSAMREKSGEDIVNRLKFTFSDKSYVKTLDASDKRWMDERIDVIIKGLVEFASKIG